MKNKYVQNCRFVHHAKFHCIMTTLDRLFKIKFERGGTRKEPIQAQENQEQEVKSMDPNDPNREFWLSRLVLKKI